jgi:hypothetical protein
LETAMIRVEREVTAGDDTGARHQVQLDQVGQRTRRVEKGFDLS